MVSKRRLSSANGYLVVKAQLDYSRTCEECFVQGFAFEGILSLPSLATQGTRPLDPSLGYHKAATQCADT